jgi:hypothetical protein
MNPFISPAIPTQTPVWMTVSDIDSIGSFFVFMDAAIKCHPIVLVLSCIVGFLFVSLLFHAFRYKDKGDNNKAVI